MDCAVKEHSHMNRNIFYIIGVIVVIIVVLKGLRALLGASSLDRLADQPPDVAQMFLGGQDVSEPQAHHHSAA